VIYVIKQFTKRPYETLLCFSSVSVLSWCTFCIFLHLRGRRRNCVKIRAVTAQSV